MSGASNSDEAAVANGTLTPADASAAKVFGVETQVAMYRLMLSVLGAAGYLPGLIVALCLYALTRNFAHIQIGMTPGRLIGVFLLSIGMCALSGMLSIRKLRAADPADLF